MRLCMEWVPLPFGFPLTPKEHDRVIQQQKVTYYSSLRLAVDSLL